MNRRRHNGSKKIPNVKLRPVPAPSEPRTGEKRKAKAFEDDGEFDPERDGGDYDAGQNELSMAQELYAEEDVQGPAGRKPFEGVNICVTGIQNPDKNEIHEKIKALGGDFTRALQEQNTHLVADGPGSAKYQFALEHSIPIMSALWIHHAHERWIKGEDFTFRETLEDYRLPCFDNLVFCLTGEELSVKDRKEISGLIQAQGGSYHANMDDTVTHLLVAGPRPSSETILSPKITFALRTNNARLAARAKRQRMMTSVTAKRRILEHHELEEVPPDINVVWIEWMRDCLSYQGRWSEDEYSYSSMERPEPRKPPKPVEPLPPLSFIGVPTSTLRDHNTSLSTMMDLSADGDLIPIAVRAQPSDPSSSTANKIWRKVAQSRVLSQAQPQASSSSRPLSPGDPTADKGKTRELPRTFKAMLPPQPGSVTPILTSVDEEPLRGRSTYLERIESKRGAAAFSESRDSSLTSNSAFLISASTVASSNAATSNVSLGHRKPFASVASSSKVPQVSKQSVAGPSTSTMTTSNENVPRIFEGVRLSALGDANNEVMRRIIQELGGIFVEPEEALSLNNVNYMIVRLDSGLTYLPKDHSSHRNDANGPQYRTECWIEYSIFHERIAGVDEHPTFAPLTCSLPIQGISSYAVGTSGLDSAELTFIKRFAKAIGLNIPQQFGRKTVTHLVCPSREGEKFNRAVKWGIPVVGTDWVYKLVDTSLTDSSSAAERSRNGAVIDLTIEDDTTVQEPRTRQSKKSPARTNPQSLNIDSLSSRVATLPLADPAEPSEPSLIPFPEVEFLDFGKPNFEEYVQTSNTSPYTNPSSSLTVLPNSSSPPQQSLLPTNPEPRSDTVIPSSQSPPSISKTTSLSHKNTSALAALLENPPVIDVDRINGPPRKRPRPMPRAKPVNPAPILIPRTGSSTSSTTSVSTSVIPSRNSSGVFGGLPSPVVPYDLDLDEEILDDSMRVTYADPGQTAARKKLMAVISDGDISGEGGARDAVQQGEPEEKKTKGKKAAPTRRSTRMAGF